MITLTFKSKKYYYENIHEGQAYDIDTTIDMDEDASLDDIMEAVIRLTKFAGYGATKSSFLRAVENVFEDREEY